VPLNIGRNLKSPSVCWTFYVEACQTQLWRDAEELPPPRGGGGGTQPPTPARDPSREGTDLTDCPFSLSNKDLQFAAPRAVKADRPWPSAVHHHHHYPPAGVLPVPHDGFPSAPTAHRWTGSALPALPT